MSFIASKLEGICEFPQNSGLLGLRTFIFWVPAQMKRKTQGDVALDLAQALEQLRLQWSSDGPAQVEKTSLSRMVL